MEEFGVRGSGWTGLPRSNGTWDEGRARAALDAWAGDDMAKYGRAFLWSNGSGTKTGFKFPIAMPVDGKLTVFNRAVSNAKARLNQADIPTEAKTRIASILNTLSGANEQMSLIAAAVPVNPPATWFANPNLTGKTKITVTDDGRVFGHLAPWDTCHLTFANTCVTVPKSRRGYADFHVGSTKTADGSVLDTGVITVDTGHADETFTSAANVKAHYDNTGTAAAVVRAGEDAYGVWIAGALVPGATEELAQKVRRAPLSGDWRRIAGNLELVAALGVNRPAFAVTAGAGADEDFEPEAFVNFEDDEITCLIASATFFAAETFDVNIIDDTIQEDFSDVTADGDCGCPDQKLGVYQLLPTLDEEKALTARLAGYASL
jgi:hypothetical protein